MDRVDAREASFRVKRPGGKTDNPQSQRDNHSPEGSRLQRAHDAELIRNLVILQSREASVEFGSRPRSVRFIRILKCAEPPSKNEQRDDSQRQRDYATNDDNKQRHPIEEMPYVPSERCTCWSTQREPSSSGFLLNKTAQGFVHRAR